MDFLPVNIFSWSLSEPYELVFVQPALRQGASSLSMAMDRSGNAPLIQVEKKIALHFGRAGDKICA
jgi:hypothetical protein